MQIEEMIDERILQKKRENRKKIKKKDYILGKKFRLKSRSRALEYSLQPTSQAYRGHNGTCSGQLHMAYCNTPSCEPATQVAAAENCMFFFFTFASAAVPSDRVNTKTTMREGMGRTRYVNS